MDAEVAVVGAGVVGCAAALALARRGVSVALLEAEPEPALGASGTNSGILHTGFDSPPGGLETEMILRAAELRDRVLERLEVPVLRCGAELRARDSSDREAVRALAVNAGANGVEVVRASGGALSVPGEAVTDPVAYTLALAAVAQRHGAELRTGFRVGEITPHADEVGLRSEGGEALDCRIAVNCAGLGAGGVARMAGDSSFDVYPRKGEFLVFEPPPGAKLERILLPVPSADTKGVLVFPTVDGMVVAGPTAVDQEDAGDWSVRPSAREEIIPQAAAMHPPLDGCEPAFAYAGLRPAGRGSANYVIRRSRARPSLVNAAAIRSTGMSAALGVAERICEIIAGMGIVLEPERELLGGAPPRSAVPWWRRAAEHRAS